MEPSGSKTQTTSKDELATDGGQGSADCQQAMERRSQAGREPNPLECFDCLMRLETLHSAEDLPSTSWVQTLICIYLYISLSLSLYLSIYLDIDRDVYSLREATSFNTPVVSMQLLPFDQCL